MSSRQPIGVEASRAGASAGARLRPAVSAARADPWGRLETVQKVLTQRLGKAGKGKPLQGLHRSVVFLRGSQSLFARGDDRHLASSYGTRCQG